MDSARPHRGPVRPSCEAVFGPISAKSVASRISGLISGSRASGHIEGLDLQLDTSTAGPDTITPWPWPRGDQKLIYTHRQTATKPTYYIRGIEIIAISGLGRFGAGGGLARDFDH